MTKNFNSALYIMKILVAKFRFRVLVNYLLMLSRTLNTNGYVIFLHSSYTKISFCRHWVAGAPICTSLISSGLVSDGRLKTFLTF